MATLNPLDVFDSLLLMGEIAALMCFCNWHWLALNYRVNSTLP
jgi:hypothetical protein